VKILGNALLVVPLTFSAPSILPVYNATADSRRDISNEIWTNSCHMETAMYATDITEATRFQNHMICTVDYTEHIISI
jgi:hypothetical protein